MDELLTVKQVSQKLKGNPNQVYDLHKTGLLKGIKLGCLKFRAITVDNFMAKYEGYDLSDLKNIIEINYQKED